MMNKLMRSLAFLITLAVVSTPLHAQNPYSVAWRVNESIVSHYDIDQRMRIMRALGAPAENLQKTATSDLIDDRLRVEAGRRLGLDVAPENIARAYDAYAEQRGLSAEQMRARLRGAGVSDEAFEDFLASTLIWRTVLSIRFGDRAEPTESELNAQVSSVALSSRRTVLLAELVLPYQERGQDATVQLARELQSSLNGGGDWGAAVAQYSRSATAAEGGTIGWVDPNRLPEQIGAAIRGVGVGGVSQLIFVPSGIIMIKILDSRSVSQPIEVPIEVGVSYAEITLANPGGTARAQMRAANQFRRTLDGCRGLPERAAAASGVLSTAGPVGLNALPADLGLALSRLDPRESVALIQPDALRIIVLCERTSSLQGEAREMLRAQLRSRIIGSLSDGLLLELRRTAMIEQQ